MARPTLAIVGLGLLLGLFALLHTFLRLPAGLQGNYYATIDATSTPVHSTIDLIPSAIALVSAWDAQPPDTFSATWSGSFITLRDGTYTFGTTSDDGSWVYIDGTLVVDNGGQHASRLVTGSIHLGRGVHRIFIRYFQAGDLLDFDLSWSRNSTVLRPMPGWALTPRRPTFTRFFLGAVLDLLVTPMLWLSAATMMAALLLVAVRVGPRVLDASDPIAVTSPSAALSARYRVLRRMGVAAGTGAAIALYVYVATAGLFPHWPPSETEFYSQQADAFLTAHTDLAAGLARGGWDASYYNGKYFIYWGPVPVVLVLVAKLFVGAAHVVPDSRLVVWFSVGLLLCKVFLLFLIRSTLFNDLKARWAVPLAFAVLACAAPQLYLLARPAIYEAAIVGAQCFLLAGVCAALFGMAPDASGRRRIGSCLAAGVFWALAIGCRAPAVLAVAILVPATAIAYRVTRRTSVVEAKEPLVLQTGLLAAPVLLGLLALGLFNKVRFDAWTEFGTSYQLTNIRPSWTGAFVIPNLYSYILRRPRVSCAFPFISSLWNLGGEAFPQDFRIPSGYIVSEPVLGLLWVAPWFAFGVVALVALFSWLVSRALKRRPLAPCGVPVQWLAFCFLILATAGGAVMLGLSFATMRYAGDVATGLSVLSVLGLLWALRWTQDHHRIAYRAVSLLSVLLAAYTVVVGILLGAEGYYGQFKSNNPKVYDAMTKSLSLPGCR